MSKKGWEEVVLGDLIIFISEKIKVSELNLNTFISTENMQPELGGIIESSGLPSATTTRGFQKNDILFSNIRTYFKKVWFADRNGGCSNDVLVFRSLEKLIPKFLYYILADQRFIDYTVTTAKGTKMPRGDRDAIEQYPIQLPPLPTQKAIAKILGDLDAKIELNRQMNENLEAMAQAVFQSWFVDFDPVLDNFLAENNNDIKALPEPLRQKGVLRLEVTKKETPKINELFPNDFVFNEVLEKWIPEGWEVKSVDESATVVGGGTPSTKIDEYFCKKGISWLSPKDLSGYKWKYIDKGAKDITDLGLQKSSAKLMPAGTVLFSSRAPIGYIAIAENEISTNQGFKSLIPNKGLPTEYLFQFLKQNAAKIESVASGSTFKEVSGSALKSIPIIVPNKIVLDELIERTKEFNSHLLVNQKQTQSLTKLRDTLLPQLISGKLSVPKAMLEF